MERDVQSKKFVCPFCEHSSDKLLPVGLTTEVVNTMQVIGAGLRLAACESCGCWDRERLVYVFLKFVLKVFGENKPTSVLHVAPEKCLSQKFCDAKIKDYIRGDLQVVGYDYGPETIPLDLISLPFEPASFDLIICNHVLEHVPQDRTAMRELWRVLKPGGHAIVQVPISRTNMQTFEDWIVTTPEEKEVTFGQRDHCRIYGQDYITRLAEAGFYVRRFNISKDYPFFGLNAKEEVFCASK